MLWCSIQPEREVKCRMIMEALAKGWPDAKCIEGDPPNDGNEFAVYGQIWGAERLLPAALKIGRPFWYIDNGFWKPGCGSRRGYYRICYRSMMPVFLKDVGDERAQETGVQMKPWRTAGQHILFALPGRDYGKALGLRMDEWIKNTRHKMSTRTNRKIVTRDRGCITPLASHLHDCWAVVTHSSNVAVEAVIAGIPVFVAPGSAAAPVGNLDLDRLEKPSMPDNRLQWWASLACQQFTPQEMMRGIAYKYLALVRDEFDGKLAA